jgi:hypothetical protein
MIGWWGINKMNYKQMPEYKELLSFGFVDITDQYKSTKPIVAFQLQEETQREPRQGDVKYVIQKSGYIRKNQYKEHYNYNTGVKKTGWDQTVRVEKFEPGLDNFDEVGVRLFNLYWKIKNKLISREEVSKLRVEEKKYMIFKILFDDVDDVPRLKHSIGYLRDYLNGNKTWKYDDYDAIFTMMYKPGKFFQGMAKLLKELGI